MNNKCKKINNSVNIYTLLIFYLNLYKENEIHYKKIVIYERQFCMHIFQNS